MDLIPYINGELFSWAKVRVNLLGATVSGITAISYSQPRVKENLPGAGAFPTGYGTGNVEPEASLTLYVDELVKLQQIAPNGDITQIPLFDIVVEYRKGNGAGEVIVTDIIRNCQFTDNGREWAQGETSSEMELTILCSHIAFNGIEPV